MNTIIKTTITFLATVLFAISCSKKDDAPAADDAPGTFTCKIEGMPFTATSASGGDNSKIVAATPGVTLATFINATGADGKTMTFSLKEAIAKVGTITCDGTNGSLVNYDDKSFPDLGSINITTFTSTRAKGTFNFTLKVLRDGVSPKIVVTDGVFDVPLANGF